MSLAQASPGRNSAPFWFVCSTREEKYHWGCYMLNVRWRLQNPTYKAKFIFRMVLSVYTPYEMPQSFGVRRNSLRIGSETTLRLPDGQSCDPKRYGGRSLPDSSSNVPPLHTVGPLPAQVARHLSSAHVCFKNKVMTTIYLIISWQCCSLGKPLSEDSLYSLDQQYFGRNTFAATYVC